jgi:hypothetical protein
MADENISTDNVDVAMMYIAMRMTYGFSWTSVEEKAEKVAQAFKVLRRAYMSSD